jgi:hypothetical protein
MALLPCLSVQTETVPLCWLIASRRAVLHLLPRVRALTQVASPGTLLERQSAVTGVLYTAPLHIEHMPCGVNVF